MRNKQKIDIETYLRKKRKKREFMEETDIELCQNGKN